MRVLHIDTEKGFRGGEQQVLSLMRGLRDLGVPQLVAVRRESELGDRVRAEGMTAVELPVHQPWDPRSWYRLRALAREHRSSLVHAHTGNAHKLALAAFQGRIPIVVTRRVDFAIRRNLFSRRKYAAQGQHYIAISTGVRDVLVEGGVPPERIDIVPSGVDSARFAGAPGREEWRARWKVAEPGPVIGVVGAYVDHKDPLNLVNAAPAICDALPGARIVFVGEGELRPGMESRIAALNMGDRVLLAGWQEDVGGCLAAMDIFVMPSKLEGLCTSLLDAQAVGLPCVACRAGGIPDIVSHGENGLLVPARDSAALARAIVELWNDETRRERFRQAGPRNVRERFSVEAMVAGTERVYRKALQSAQQP